MTYFRMLVELGVIKESFRTSDFSFFMFCLVSLLLISNVGDFSQDQCFIYCCQIHCILHLRNCIRRFVSRCNNCLVLLIKDVDGLVSIHLGFTLVMIFLLEALCCFTRTPLESWYCWYCCSFRYCALWCFLSLLEQLVFLLSMSVLLCCPNLRSYSKMHKIQRTKFLLRRERL